MYINFYDKNDKCLYSVKVNSEKQAEKLADIEYQLDYEIEDWTLTGQPMSEEILG